MLLFFHKIKSRKIHDEAVLHTLHLEFSSIKNRQAFGSQLQIETIVFFTRNPRIDFYYRDIGKQMAQARVQ
jgi:hypothetical protein